MTRPPRVDAHFHVWRVDRGDYDWLRPGFPIYRDYGLADHARLRGDIAAGVLVQAAATEAETAFMIDVAKSSGGVVRAVVGWTDLSAPDAADRVAAMADEPLLRGLRPMLQDIPDTFWILRPEIGPGLAAMARAGMRLDVLARPRHLPLLLELAARHPDLPMVIDHAAKPAIAEGGFQPWADDIKLVARETPAFCKLSGLATEASPAWTVEDLRPYVAHLLDCFGPDRLMWGSDWPVVDLAGGFARWRDAARSLVPDPARDAVFGATASRFYGF
jgi:L-fuconolactonase